MNNPDNIATFYYMFPATQSLTDLSNVSATYLILACDRLLKQNVQKIMNKGFTYIRLITNTFSKVLNHLPFMVITL